MGYPPHQQQQQPTYFYPPMDNFAGYPYADQDHPLLADFPASDNTDGPYNLTLSAQDAPLSLKCTPPPAVASAVPQVFLNETPPHNAASLDASPLVHEKEPSVELEGSPQQ